MTTPRTSPPTSKRRHWFTVLGIDIGPPKLSDVALLAVVSLMYVAVVQLLPLHSEHLKAVFVGTFIGSLTVACGVSIADHGWRAMVIVAVTSTTSLALCDLLTR